MKKIIPIFLTLASLCSFVFANGQQEMRPTAKTAQPESKGPVTITILTTATTQNPEGPLAKGTLKSS
jgi:hypothetical protein